MKNLVWRPNSWRAFPIKQQPDYDNMGEVFKLESQLINCSSIVKPNEVDLLITSLQCVANEDAIILHGGDCVETFAGVNQKNLSEYMNLMLDVSSVLKKYKEVVLIGRVAGQFAKPRSSEKELREDVELPIYKGDIINSIEFSYEARQPNAKRLLDGYICSVKAKEYLKRSGFSSRLGHYISHEALLLNYEQCFTRVHKDKYYNLSTHFLWVGNRTRNIGDAHIEYIRGIYNPVGIKIDGNVTKDELIRLIEIVNPDNISGRLTLIFRMGEKNVKRCLPDLIREIKSQGKKVILICDPMHGNTIIKSWGKTRNINTILLELSYFIDILKAENMDFGGVHLEMSNQMIIECVDENESTQNYSSYCDPRLNYQQSMRVANFILDRLKE